MCGGEVSELSIVTAMERLVVRLCVVCVCADYFEPNILFKIKALGGLSKQKYQKKLNAKKLIV